MTILSRIRNRVGLLVGIIFLALLSFVLTDLFSAQNIFGGQQSSDLGEINGNTITLKEFQRRVDKIEIDQKRTLSEEEQQQLSESFWMEKIDEHVYEPEWKKVGISLTDNELAEQMYGDRPSPHMNAYFQDPQTGQIAQQFAGPDGSLSGEKIRDFVKKMEPKVEEQWAQIEDALRKTLIKEKYNTLLRKGFYVTSAQAKREYADENTKYNFKYIVKKFTEIPDSTVKVTDEEMKEYYVSHQWKFKQANATRSMEYVAFDIYPSAQDIADQRNAMEKVRTEFQAKKGEEDSLYVTAMSTSGAYQKSTFRAGIYPAGADSAFITAQTGDVLGPYINGEIISVYKKAGEKTSVDSAKVRHILVACKGCERAGPEIVRTKPESKKRADSIQRVVKNGKAKLEDLVEKLSDDPGSKSGNKGDYGWFTAESGFVQEFKDAGFNNPVGAVVVVETSFGYHVIEVLDRTKPSLKVEAISIDRQVEPSNETVRDIYNKASEFASRNTTAEAFKAATSKEHMNVLQAPDIAENSRTIQGIENPREIVRWLYAEDVVVGAISAPFQSSERFIVAHLTKAIDKGFKPFEEVREICEIEARKIRKAEILTGQMNKAKAATLDQWASKSGTGIASGANVTISQPYVQGAGYEGTLVGTLATMKQGEVKGPINGTLGVYVITLDSVTKPEPLKDVASQKSRSMQALASRADATAMEVLKEKAEIIDNRAKHF